MDVGTPWGRIGFGWLGLATWALTTILGVMISLLSLSGATFEELSRALNDRQATLAILTVLSFLGLLAFGAAVLLALTDLAVSAAALDVRTEEPEAKTTDITCWRCGNGQTVLTEAREAMCNACGAACTIPRE